MALRTLVKVGKISNLSDARYCAGMGVDMLGFRVIPDQQGYVSLELFREMRGWFNGPSIVAEAYGLQSSADLQSVIENYAPDEIELSVKEFQFIVPGSKYILSLHPEEFNQSKDEILKHKDQIVHIILPENSDNNLVATLSNDFSVLIRTDNIDSVNSFIKNESISGFVLEGTEEVRPGLKNYDTLSDILEVLELEN